MDVKKPDSYFSKSTLNWLGFLLIIFILGGTLFLWKTIRKNELQNQRQLLHDATTLISRPIENTVTGYIDAVGRMSKRWNNQNGIPPAAWIRDISNYYNDTKIFDVFLWLDQDKRIKWIIPSDASKQFNLSNLKIGSAVQPKLSVMTSANANNPEQFFLSAPLINQQKLDGYIVAVANSGKLFRQIFPKNLSDNYGFAIYQNNKKVFHSGDEIVDPSLVQRVLIVTQGLTWNLEVWPTQTLLASMASPLPWIVLLTGLGLSFLVFTIFDFYNRMRHRDQQIQASRAQAEVSARNAQAILQAVKEGFVTIDENSIIQEWNPYAEEMFGWTKAEVIGKKLYDVIIPERYRQAHKVGLQRFLMTGVAPVFNKIVELAALHKDGHEFPVDLVIFPMRLKIGYVFHAFIRDITERKKLETDQATFLEIVKSSDDAIITVDLEGKILDWNSGAEQMYGYTAEEMVGQSIWKTYVTENPNDYFQVVESIKRGQHVSYPEAQRKAKDGHIVPVSIIFIPIKDKNGKIIYCSSIARDLTERINIDKMKNEFISIVSHELRTPLTSIRGSIGLLVSGKIATLPPKVIHLLEIANNNSERLIRLINDILDIEKIEAGKMQFRFKKINLVQLVKEAILANQGLADRNNVKLDFQSKVDVEVTADYDRIMQVVTNLLSNAIRYSPSNGVVVSKISLMKHKVRVSVTDDGSGIPAAFQDKIFEKFSQADSSDSRKLGGTGLGLNISRAIVEKHGGFISFISTEGKGSTFYFDLPYEYESDISDLIIEGIGKPKVLICDSNGESANYLKELLDSHNILADIADSAKQARELIQNNTYACITVDLALPDEDGVTFIGNLRNNTSTKDTPIVVISVRTKEEAQRLRGNGFEVADWLEKPINEDGLKRILNYITNKFVDKTPIILNIEDDKDVTRLISYILQSKAQVWNTSTIAKGREMLNSREFDLVILDLNLPDGNGAELLPCINYRTKQPIPVIVFSIDELQAKYVHMVKQALLKTVASNEQLLKAIESAIQIEKQHEDETD